MAARSFRVVLVNNTSFKLFRVVSEAYLHGEWSEGMEAPDEILPKQAAIFQAESDGIFVGTEGHIVYEVDDRGPGRPAPPGFPPVSERVKIHWNNPYVGTTSSDGTMLVSTGFFEDRHPGSSMIFNLAGGGRRHLDEFPEPLDTEGWLELIPGFVALPIPNLGVINHAWSAFSIDESPQPFPSFGNQSGPISLRFSPVVNAPSDAWIGAFVFPSGLAQDASLRVRIDHALRNEVMQLQPASFDVSLEETGGMPGVPRLVLQQGGIRETVETTYNYQQDVWPPRAPSLNLLAEKISTSSAVLTMKSLLQVSDLLSSRIPAASHATHTTNIDLSQLAKLTPSKTADILMATADSLIVGYDNITLMLYSVTDSKSFLGYTIRYIRFGRNGEALVDVMLSPALKPIA